MKLWLFRYAGWFIVSIKWFKPRKTKSKRTRNKGTSYITSVNRGYKPGALLKRVKLLMSFMALGIRHQNLNYYF